MAIVKTLIVKGVARFLTDAYMSTIRSGIWNGSTIQVGYGGTGVTSAKGDLYTPVFLSSSGIAPCTVAIPHNTKDFKINGTTYSIFTTYTGTAPTIFAPTALAGTGGYILATNSAKTGLEWVAKPVSNVTTSAVLADAANSKTQLTAEEANPYYNLIEGGSVTRSVQFVAGEGMTVGTTDGSDIKITNVAPIYYIKGNADTTAGTWTGTDTRISEYYEGLTIVFVPLVAGASTTTLNINGLGAKTCYVTNTSKLTTHFAVGTPIMFTYYGGYWKRADYDSNSNTWRGIYTSGTSRVGTGTNTKAMNFASSNLDITYLAAGTATGQSGNANYFTIGIEAKDWTGATSSAAGTAGYMPGAAVADRTKFLRGDGSWVALSLTDHTHSVKINGSTKTIASPGGTAVDLGNYVLLDAGAAEQTIKNSIGSLANGSIEIWRATSGGYAMIGFANGTTKTSMGMLGFAEANKPIFRNTSGTNYLIAHAGNIVNDNTSVSWNTETTIATIAGVTVKIKIPANPDRRKAFYGTCNTAAATAAKVVTLSNTDGWVLVAGTVIGVKFTNSNTASSVTLAVNGEAAKSIFYDNAAYTGSSTDVCGKADRLVYYMYDGTYWVYIGNSYIINTTYSALTVALLEAGTNTSNRVASAKVLSDWLHTKPHTVSGIWTHSAKIILNTSTIITSSTITDTTGGGMLFYNEGNILGAFGDGTTATIPTYIRSTGNNLYHRKGKSSAYTDHLIADAGNISDKAATITTSSTTLATIAGVNITAKMSSSAYDGRYVKLVDTEQTIESTISSYSKGIIEFYRSSGNHIAFILFANKDNNGNKLVLGAIGFHSGSPGQLEYRSASATYHAIAHAGNITSANATIGTSLTTIATIAGVDIKAKIPDVTAQAIQLASVEKTLAVSTWTDMAAINTYTGTYAIQISSGNVYASGVFTACGGTDSVIDEIPLHVADKGTNTWRPYARISAGQLLMTTNEATGTARTYTIKILKLI